MKKNSLILLLLLFFIGTWLAQAAGLIIIRFIFPEADVASLAELGKKNPGAWQVIRLVQLLHAFLSMVVPAVVVMKWAEGQWFPRHSQQQQAPVAALIYIPLLLFSLMPLLQKMYVLNQSFHIPGQLGESLRGMEEQMNSLIQGILADKSPGAMIFNFLLMVVVAAIAEELFFRGALLRFLMQRTGDEHLSIFISALIFSAVHMQFFGFLPRLALGILFGYLYIRTLRLIAPIFAHALFNGLQIGTYYYAVSKGVGAEEEDLLLLPLGFTLASTLLFLLLYYSFHTYTEKKE